MRFEFAFFSCSLFDFICSVRTGVPSPTKVASSPSSFGAQHARCLPQDISDHRNVNVMLPPLAVLEFLCRFKTMEEKINILARIHYHSLKLINPPWPSKDEERSIAKTAWRRATLVFSSPNASFRSFTTNVRTLARCSSTSS